MEGTISGHCRCGAVALRVVAEPLMTMACHCTGCRRMTASAFSLSMLLPASGLTVVSGTIERGGAGTGPFHAFCPRCKAWLFTRPEGLEDFVNLRATVLDDHGGFAPYAEFWTREQLPWATTPAVRSFETVPEPTGWAELLAAYAASRATHVR